MRRVRQLAVFSGSPNVLPYLSPGSPNVLPYLSPDKRVGLGILHRMVTLWHNETPVVLHYMKDQVDIMRLATEYWATETKIYQPSEVARVILASYVVDLVGLVNYMGANLEWEEDASDKVTADI